MSETTEQDKKSDKKRLSLNRPGRLELKKTVDAGPVRQNFSHGRSKMVAVEVRKKRTYAPDSSGKMSKVSEREAREAELAAAAASEAAEVEVEERPLSPDSPQLAGLTDEEKAQRIRVLEEARKADEAARIEAERKAREAEEARKRQAEAAAEEAEVEAESGAEASPEAAEEAAEAEELTPEEQAQRIAEEQARQKEAEQQRPAKARVREAAEEEEERAKPRKAGKADAKKPSPSPRREERRRRSGKLTIVEAESFEAEEDRQRSLASVKRQRERDRQKQQELRQEGRKILREVTVPESITVQELANRMAERGGDVIKVLMKMGTMATINEYLDQDTAELVAAEFGHTIKRVSESDVEIGLAGGDDKEKDLQPRAPVVTVMGHVDHGKTSLLDALRQSDVAAHEAGGITQHIGAYQVESAAGGKITFIDTPGHAAFTEMRSRGAKVTDIVVLVVAADDGIMPQTVEAIDHARAAEVPIIVAINKIDKPGADANRVKTELLNHNIQVEDMGGEVLAVEVSALKRTGLDKLEEAIALQAELLDLRANPDRPAEGVIVESKMEQGRGSVATVLVQRGTLQVGDIFVAGAQWGRVRALIDAKGEQVDTAGPSVPVEVLGLQGTPQAGDEVVVVDSEARAREVSEFRQRRDREAKAALSGRGTLEQMFEKIKEGETQTLPVLVKADVHGSLEAILGALDKLGTDEVAVQVLHSGVGGINESDVTLARASDALVIGFNVRANPQAREHAKRDGVDIRYYSIIYNLTDDLKQMLSGMLAPALRENTLGYAEIREVFSITKTGKVAGCMVTEGMVKRGAKVRLLRDDVVIHEGELSQLKRFKDDVREVKEGFECGMAFANYQDIQVGDFIECFEVEEVAREI